MRNLATRIADPPADESESVPVVIVGTGPAGIRAAEELLARAPGTHIVMYGDEPWEPYNRVRLSSLLAGEVRVNDLRNVPRIPDDRWLVTHLHCAVVAIDRGQKCVVDQQGRVQRYSKLILATGSRPHIPGIPNVDLAGIFTFRDLGDVQHLLARRTRSRHTVILGGGLLGLEAARAMQRMNTRVTVVEHATHLMSRQLDVEGGEYLREFVMSLGIQVILANGAAEFIGDTHVQGVRLRNGRMLECDTVILAAGIRPRAELAQQAHLVIRQGVQVSDAMQTSDPDIYAIGECSEHNGVVQGLVAPGLEQAAIVADRLSGGKARYKGSVSASKLKVLGMLVFSMGETGNEISSVSYGIYRYENKSRSQYRKIIVHRGKVIGAISVGDWDEINRIQEVITNGRRIWPWQFRRFVTTGRLWPGQDAASVVDWPAVAIVCNCTGVRRGDLGGLIRQGCNTLESLAQKSGASTVCGSCKPLLAELVGAQVSGERQPFNKLLVISALLAVVLGMLWILPGPIAAGDSINTTSFKLSVLWRDGLWKQVTGFSLLGLTLLGLAVSFRKRLRAFRFGAFGLWRSLHAMLGSLALLALAMHTGLQPGENINAWLLMNYLVVAVVGVFAGMSVVSEQHAGGFMVKQARRWTSQLHLLLGWPLPVLLGFHVLSVYYF